METILLIVLMFVVFYFFLIRPENKRKKTLKSMRESLARGDQVTTIGGLTGTICDIKEDHVVIETGADRVRIQITKWAIASKGINAAEPTK